MTYEEALNINQKWTAQQAFNDLERYLLRGEKPALKAVAVSMEALKKQIPQKTINTYKKGNDKDGYCPECGAFIDNRNLYCDCGQAIDWSD